MKCTKDTIQFDDVMELELIEDGLMLYRKQMIEHNRPQASIDEITALKEQIGAMIRNWEFKSAVKEEIV